MKEKFDFPEITIYSFSASDIVTASASGPFTEGGNGDDNIYDGLIPDPQQ